MELLEDDERLLLLAMHEPKLQKQEEIKETSASPVEISLTK
jgi:hypothetical protein